MNVVTFLCGRFKYGTIEVTFSTKVEAVLHVPKILKSENVNQLFTYKYRRSIRFRIGRISPEIE